MTLSEKMTELARHAREASRQLARLSADEKNGCLIAMADALVRHSDRIREANARDLRAAADMGLSRAMLERLELTDQRVESMARGLRDVAALPDPAGRTLEERVRPNGLKLRKVTCPLGVVVIIYESRPNVTADAASLCFKAGSATILRGGKEAIASNQIIAEIMISAARARLAGFPGHAIQVVPTTDRAAIPELLSLTQYVDLCMPRGGEGLIRAVAECSKVPVIKHYKGVCHVYVDRRADPELAVSIPVNAKAQRPSVCNAAETLIVHREVADRLLPKIAAALGEANVELRVDARARLILDQVASGCALRDATEEDWSTEYNDYILNVRVVDDLAQAVSHVNHFGSGHSDAIVTTDESAALTFLNDVDSAAVYWNASTRFTDGAEFGMGAEIGISTDKIGARGPMGLEELMTYKWLCFGNGQLRS